MSSEELILKLFDFLWFEHGVFSTKSPPSTAAVINPILDVGKDVIKPTPTIFRSFSDQALSLKDESISDSSSPKSVLSIPKLQTIVSGKEVGKSGEEDKENNDSRRPRIRRRRRKGNSKSMSELEYEEVKGFIDLGFVFSDEDKSSNLVTIIPGLQRLRRKEDQIINFEGSEVSRPYLSEAWDVMEKKNPLMNWRIPDFGNELELKDHLKCWAHSVASTVR